MRSQDAVSVEPFTRLSRMPGYAVERHEPDPRGWTVVNGQGKKVGEVKDLIVDTNRMTARYLDVELDTKLIDWRGDDPHILVPVEHAHIDGKHLVVPDITQTWVADLRAQRNVYVHEFWNRWWTRGERHPGAGLATRIGRAVQPEDLQRVIDDVQPGETVRIPVVNEEIVVQRRPATDETPTGR
jgi:sporulation protein YlmC with PRC-barrel domain